MESSRSRNAREIPFLLKAWEYVIVTLESLYFTIVYEELEILEESDKQIKAYSNLASVFRYGEYVNSNESRDMFNVHECHSVEQCFAFFYYDRRETVEFLRYVNTFDGLIKKSLVMLENSGEMRQLNDITMYRECSGWLDRDHEFENAKVRRETFANGFYSLSPFYVEKYVELGAESFEATTLNVNCLLVHDMFETCSKINELFGEQFYETKRRSLPWDTITFILNCCVHDIDFIFFVADSVGDYNLIECIYVTAKKDPREIFSTVKVYNWNLDLITDDDVSYKPNIGYEIEIARFAIEKYEQVRQLHKFWEEY